MSHNAVEQLRFPTGKGEAVLTDRLRLPACSATQGQKGPDPELDVAFCFEAPEMVSLRPGPGGWGQLREGVCSGARA